MKVLDFNEITAEITRQMNETDYTLPWIIGESLAKMMVLSIYMTNDILDAYGQDLRELGVSIITSQTRCSVIIGKNMSWYKYDEPICLYESLSDDIAAILRVIEAAIDRIDQ